MRTRSILFSLLTAVTAVVLCFSVSAPAAYAIARDESTDPEYKAYLEQQEQKRQEEQAQKKQDEQEGITRSQSGWAIDSDGVCIIPDGTEVIPAAEFAIRGEMNDSFTGVAASHYEYNTALKSVVLPDTVKVIEANAFRGCSELTSICFPKSIERIGEYAFRNCRNLVDIAFEGDGADISIDPYAFTVGDTAAVDEPFLAKEVKYGTPHAVKLTALRTSPDLYHPAPRTTITPAFFWQQEEMTGILYAPNIISVKYVSTLAQ